MSSLTKYPVGSVRELWSVSAPLMLSSFSLLAMVFVDRVFLAHFSADAMSAAVTAGTAAWAVFGSLLILASLSEVLVAQYNGAGMHEKVGRPVWQMIWFSLASLSVLIPLGLWGGELLFHNSVLKDQEILYWKWFLLLGVSFPIQGALAAFYVGRGKTKLVMCLALLANVANVILDWLLIFGVSGWFEPMGVKGAAIATCTGNMLQTIVLLVLVLQRKYREQYGTNRFQLHFREMGKVLRVGVPQSTLFFIECIGWALFYIMIGHVGPEQIFIAGTCQSILILFFFAAEGIGRGAAAISGNLIGAGRGAEAFKVFRAGLRFHIAFFVLASLAFIVYPDWFIDLFVSKGLMKFQEHGAIGTMVDVAAIEGPLRTTLQLCLFYLFFEGLRWLVSGILSAAGDTVFLLIAGTITVPLFMLLPTFGLIEKLGYGVVVAFAIAIGYSFATSTIFLFRFFGRRWQKINLLA